MTQKDRASRVKHFNRGYADDLSFGGGIGLLNPILIYSVKRLSC